MADYISRHTGEEIDTCVDRIQDLDIIEEALNSQNNLITTMNKKLHTIEREADLYAPTHYLTEHMALISDGSGKITTSIISDNELSSLAGVTTNIQAQLNNKAPAYTYSTTDLTAGTSALTTGSVYFVYE